MTQALFWLSIGLMLYVYFGYPLVMVVLAKLIRRKPWQISSKFPDVTLIIAAYNEEKVIRAKLENALALDYPGNLDILVASDGSSDATDSIVAEYARRGVRLNRVEGRGGKTAALNKTVPLAKGEIIVFSDANSMYDAQAIRELVIYFADPRIGCVSGELHYINEDESMVGSGEGLYWRYETFLKRKEQEVNTLLFTNGSIYAIRKDLFLPINPSLADDFVVPMRIAARGYKVIQTDKARAFEKTSTVTQDEYKRKVRIVSRDSKAVLHHLKELWQGSFLLAFQMISHKFLRWLVFLFMLVAFGANLFLLHNPFYQIVFMLQVVFYMVALFGYFAQEKGWQLRYLNIPFYFCMVNIAASMGFYRNFKGRQTAVWEKPESTRS